MCYAWLSIYEYTTNFTPHGRPKQGLTLRPQNHWQLLTLYRIIWNPLPVCLWRIKGKECLRCEMFLSGTSTASLSFWFEWYCCVSKNCYSANVDPRLEQWPTGTLFLVTALNQPSSVTLQWQHVCFTSGVKAPLSLLPIKEIYNGEDRMFQISISGTYYLQLIILTNVLAGCYVKFARSDFVLAISWGSADKKKLDCLRKYCIRCSSRNMGFWFVGSRPDGGRTHSNN